MENKRLHLELIQGVINRMARCSFLLKGWSVVLVSALFALAASNTNLHFIYLAYFPAIAFWVLDGFFLWQEKLFRKLYDFVRQVEDDDKGILGIFLPNQTLHGPTWISKHGKVYSWDHTKFSDWIEQAAKDAGR